MLVLLSWLACVGEAPSVPNPSPPTAQTQPHAEVPANTIATTRSTAPVTRRAPPSVAVPPGEPIVDEGCFGATPDLDVVRKSRTLQQLTGGGTTGAAAPKDRAPSAPSRAAPRKSPAPKPTPDAAPIPTPSPAAAAEVVSVADADDARERVANEARGDGDHRAEPAEAFDADWGATVYLSNDDSMSLASAQRLLWSVQNGRVPTVGQIRPHELLNYFSFDTAPVPEGQPFSVLGGAAQNGDTLSVAFAVQGALPERRPLDLTVVVDRSGSMRAEDRMGYTQRGLHRMAEQLQPGDRVDLVLFDDRVCTPLRNYVAGRDDPSLLARVIDQMQPRGATDLDAGLREAYRLQTARPQSETHGRNRRVLLLTDAMLNTGNVDEALVAEVGKQLEAHDIRLTGVGVGRDFNDAMLDKLTEKGKGAYVYLGSEAVVDRVFGAGFRSLTETLAHDVRFALDLPDSLAMQRFYGEEASTNAEDIQPIHYYAGTSQVFLQDLTLRRGQVVPSDPVTLTISWRDARTDEPDTLRLETTVGALLDGDRRNLDKARALMAWTDIALARALRGDACGAPLQTYLERTASLDDDAEIAYVTGLAGRMCPAADVSARPATGVAVKVKVDSDVPIAEVGLDCGGGGGTRALSGNDTVARFEAARPGACTVTLHGAVPMVSSVEVPSTGGDLRCLVRGGRVHCG